ncbi:MAG: outer membrane protein assembly factor BamB family protein [Anaerolineales bacterium]
MKRLTVVSLILLASVLLSACATGASSGSWPGLAADKDRAYLANGATLFAVRLTDGGKAWQYPLKTASELYYSNPLVTPDGQLLVGSSGRDNALVSLDPATGTEKWAAPFVATDHWVATPLVVDKTIYAPNNNGKLYAINLTTGQQLWTLPVSAHSLWGAPATDGKLIFVSSLDHFLYAVDPNAQKIVWKTDLGGSIPSAPSIAADGASLYVGTFAKKVFSLDAATGAIRWTAGLKDWVWDTPSLVGDTLFAADISGNVYSLGAPNGKNAWPEVKPDGPITGSPVAVPNGVAVATESGLLYAFKNDGSSLWPPVTIGGKIYTSPVVSGDRLLVAPMGATYLLYAVNPKDGSLLPWHFDGK